MATKKIKRIAVIGGGAKGVAIAAKAFAARLLGEAQIEVTLFERVQIGAHWQGPSGYTDGDQRLCTPIERDLGFPYGSERFSAPVQSLVHEMFSWPSFKVSTQGHRSWVDGGRQPPTHSEFAEYLQWAVDQLPDPALVEYTEVSQLVPIGRQWEVQHKRGRKHVNAAKAGGLFDAVVVTGPGPARRVPGSRNRKAVFDGRDFWQRSDEVHALLADETAEVIVAGAGGTAAAIIAWLVRQDRQRQIILVAEQPALYSRGDSTFENQLFTEDFQWQSLPKESRRQFVDRLTRGVVWGSVMRDLERAEGLTFQYGRAASYVTHSNYVSVNIGAHVAPQTAEIFIDATGFDAWWFLDLIPGTSKLKARAKQRNLESGVSSDLRLQGRNWKFPPLHAPFVSGVQGPGLVNLMALGGMADRILARYK